MKKLIIISLVFALFGFASKNEVKVTIKNPLSIKRVNETVEVSMADIAKKIGDNASYVVIDPSGVEIPSQLIFAGESKPQKLIFQVTISENRSAEYTIKKGKPNTYPQKAFGRFVPERYDDYAWENDRIAFRIYGLALIPKDGASNGVDVWNKRTNNLIVDKWYSDYLVKKISYHKDNGEGCDCFKVGRTLGAGGMAPYVNDSIWLGINFQSYQVLDNGPIRTSFKLSYPAFYVNNQRVIETRTFSLDAGSQMNAVVEEFDNSFQVASGIAKRKEGEILLKDASKGLITYKLDVGENGTTYLGVVSTVKANEVKENKDHFFITMDYKKGEKLLYYTGAGWNKWGFETPESWNSYIEEFSSKIKNPLIVELN